MLLYPDLTLRNKFKIDEVRDANVDPLKDYSKRSFVKRKSKFVNQNSLPLQPKKIKNYL